MGYNPGLLDLMIGWAQQYGIRRGAAVLDVGAQELFCADDPPVLNRFIAHFGGRPLGEPDLARLSNRAFARELFGHAGLTYQAVDITPYPGTLRIDLNTGSLPFWRRSRYDIVTNNGTTEHILNQFNAFRLIHDACKVGGLMYHGVPMCGDFEHGLFSYNPRFFMLLASANGYEVMRIWASASESATSRPDTNMEWNGPFGAQDAWLHVLLRKAKRGTFQSPSDCVGWPPEP
jgi:hypothetical protein